MNIGTNLQGRLRNTPLTTSGGMLPLYEAVSNSIHALEDAGLSTDKGRIAIQIIRDNQIAMDFGMNKRRPGPDAKSDIIGFKIIDNGIGFNDDNMTSFLTLDSDYKADRGGRGVGRLLWLKAFDCVQVDSVFLADGGIPTRRTFKFDRQLGVSESETAEVGDAERQTTIHLAGFSKRYRTASPKTANVIAKNLLEHCLWYFVRPHGAPTIEIVDDDDTVSLYEIYDVSTWSSAPRPIR